MAAPLSLSPELRPPQRTAFQELVAANRALQLEVSRLTLVASLPREIGAGDDPAVLIQTVLQRAQTITNASGAAFETIDGDGMLYRAASGTLLDEVGLRIPGATSLSGRCAREGVAFHCSDALTDPRVDRELCQRLAIRSMIVLPLATGQGITGVLKVVSGEVHAFNDSDVGVLELMGGIVGGALSRAEAAEQVRLREKAEALALHLQSLAQAIPQIVWTADSDGNRDYYNQRWFDYTGLTPEQSKGWGWRPVLHPDDLELGVQRWTTAFQTGGDYEVEYRFKRASDGAFRWHLGRATAVRDAGGAIVKWFGTCTDIDDQKRAAENLAELKRKEGLRQGEESFRAAFDHSGIGMALVGLDGSWMQVNAALCRIVGHSREELLKSDVQSITHPEDIEKYLQQMKQLDASRNDSYEIEKRYVHKDGHVVWVLVTPAVVRDAARQPLHFIIQIQDITERRRAETELRLADAKARRSETLYRAMARNFPNGSIMLFNQELRYLAADGAALAEMGLSREELEGKTIHQVFAKETCDQMEPNYRAALAGQDRKLDLPFAGHVYESRFLPVRDTDGSVLCGMVMTQDVSAKKLQDEVILGSLREKEVLLKEIHHRVKNNLQVICSLLSLQARRLPEGEARAALRESHGRVQAIAEFHERLYRSPHLSDLDSLEYLEGLARGALRAFATDGVELVVIGAAVPLGVDAAIPCGLIVNELVTNAIKYAFPAGGHGKVTLGLELLDGARVRLSVEDDGVGVPADFEARRGRSLGLQLVATLAGQLGGALAVRPVPCGRFELEFPLQKQEI